jgi:hypothetical protein
MSVSRCKRQDAISHEDEEDQRGMGNAHMRDWANVFLIVAVILAGLELVSFARRRQPSFDGHG